MLEPPILSKETRIPLTKLPSRNCKRLQQLLRQGWGLVSTSFLCRYFEFNSSWFSSTYVGLDIIYLYLRNNICGLRSNPFNSHLYEASLQSLVCSLFLL